MYMVLREQNVITQKFWPERRKLNKKGITRGDFEPYRPRRFKPFL